MTQQGLHVEGDDVCPKAGKAFAKNFNSNHPGLNSGQAMALIQRRFDRVRSDHACDKYEDCPSNHCPMTATGEYHHGDSICSKLPSRWIAVFPVNYKGAAAKEAQAAIQKTYDAAHRTTRKAATA